MHLKPQGRELTFPHELHSLLSLGKKEPLTLDCLIEFVLLQKYSLAPLQQVNARRAPMPLLLHVLALLHRGFCLLLKLFFHCLFPLSRCKLLLL